MGNYKFEKLLLSKYTHFVILPFELNSTPITLLPNVTEVYCPPPPPKKKKKKKKKDIKVIFYLNMYKILLHTTRTKPNEMNL